MKKYHQRKSLKEFSDRELLLFILSNQVTLYRQTQYLMNAVKDTEGKHIGFHSDTFKELIEHMDDILKQADEHLNQEDADKGFLAF